MTIRDDPREAGQVSSVDIAGELRRQIAASRFILHERLPPERSLAERYGVARGTVRQALRQLEEMGLVERRPGSGTYVIWSDRSEPGDVVATTRPLELVDARFAVEPQMCRLAVLRATEQELSELRSFLVAMERCESESQKFAETDEAFHLALARCAQNPMITWFMERIHEARSHAQWARMRLLTLSPGIIRVYNRQHREVVEAITERDPERAAQAMKTHLATARQTLVDVAD